MSFNSINNENGWVNENYELISKGNQQLPYSDLEKLTKMADNGHIDAQYILGTKYGIGDGVELNYDLAEHYLELAADNGDKEAQNNLATIYLSESSGKQDIMLAIMYFEKSAEQGFAPAQYNLGSIYYQSEFVRDYNEAIKYYTLAANQNHAIAQFTLGVMYYKGLGVCVDHEKAKELFNESCNNGYERACDFYDKLNNNWNWPLLF